MKKFLLSAFGVAMLILLLTIVAHAHPGRTDSSGGHYNNSTGDYHYHHGYSAHDHYDMDGDGVLDCPYDFNDKTNHNSSSGSSSTANSNKKTDKSEITFWAVVKAILLLIPFSLITLYLLYIILGLLGIAVEWFIKKCFKATIEEAKMERILHISMIIGLVILVPLEFICILGIL